MQGMNQENTHPRASTCPPRVPRQQFNPNECIASTNPSDLPCFFDPSVQVFSFPSIRVSDHNSLYADGKLVKVSDSPAVCTSTVVNA
mmetsp:Transcript_12332/g.31338  ORF Transcript_12332/g.31338 Transcript_12332/m.31338 type:complete len:87 (-) Transcript_12332:38-298(-)